MSFLFDEQISPRVSRALREMGEPVNHVHDVAELGRGAKDPQILPYCGKFEIVLVTLDRQILKTPHLRALLTEHQVGAFFLRGGGRKGTPSPWEIFSTTVKHWREMQRIAEHVSRPFAKMVKPRGAIEDAWRSRRRK